MTANLNEDPSGGKCQSDNTVQGTSRGTEKGGRKTNGSERSQRMKSRKNTK